MTMIHRFPVRFREWSGRVTRARLLWALAAAALLVAGISLVEMVARDIKEREEAIAQSHMIAELSTLRARLESEINASLYRVHGLNAFVATNPTIEQEQFQELAAEIVREGSHIRNIGLAPDNVLRFVYPLEGNEQAIGLSYRDSPAQWPAVQQAMVLGQTVITGPIDLVQGGTALVARTPISAIPAGSDDPEDRYYWGLTSIVISDTSLFAESLQDAGSNLEIAVRNRGKVLFGNPEVFLEPSVVLPVRVPVDYWEIAAVRNGLPAFLDEMVLKAQLLGYGFLAALLVVVVLLAQSYRRRMKDSLTDALTGLPNRRLLIARLEVLVPLQLRQGDRLYVMFVDLDGFKPINDDFGHAAGDHLLVQIAKRLRETTRRNDTVARTGGDEFLVALPGIASAADAEAIAHKLEAAVSRPVEFSGRQLSVGCSIGMASVPEDAKDMDTLMAVADRRMYAIKQQRKKEVGSRAEPAAAVS